MAEDFAVRFGKGKKAFCIGGSTRAEPFNGAPMQFPDPDTLPTLEESPFFQPAMRIEEDLRKTFMKSLEREARLMEKEKGASLNLESLSLSTKSSAKRLSVEMLSKEQQVSQHVCGYLQRLSLIFFQNCQFLCDNHKGKFADHWMKVLEPGRNASVLIERQYVGSIVFACVLARRMRPKKDRYASYHTAYHQMMKDIRLLSTEFFEPLTELLSCENRDEQWRVMLEKLLQDPVLIASCANGFVVELFETIDRLQDFALGIWGRLYRKKSSEEGVSADDISKAVLITLSLHLRMLWGQQQFDKHRTQHHYQVSALGYCNFSEEQKITEKALFIKDLHLRNDFPLVFLCQQIQNWNREDFESANLVGEKIYFEEIDDVSPQLDGVETVDSDYSEEDDDFPSHCTAEHEHYGGDADVYSSDDSDDFEDFEKFQKSRSQYESTRFGYDADKERGLPKWNMANMAHHPQSSRRSG